MFVCVVIVSWIARINQQLDSVSSWGNRSLQANRRSISPGFRTRTGDTMIKINTLSMAVFALLANSAVLLSLSI